MFFSLIEIISEFPDFELSFFRLKLPNFNGSLFSIKKDKYSTIISFLYFFEIYL